MLSTAPRASFYRSSPQLWTRSLSMKKTAMTSVKAAAQLNNITPKSVLDSLAKPVSLVTLSSLVFVLPAYAEAGKLFDFNLTLPVMATQFLILMVFLDKTWFTPVGNLLDERDKTIRDQLESVSSNRKEIEKLEKDSDEKINAAKTESQAKINESREGVEAENSSGYKQEKANVEAEIVQAFEDLQTAKSEYIRDLSPQIEALTERILASVLPQDVVV